MIAGTRRVYQYICIYTRAFARELSYGGSVGLVHNTAARDIIMYSDGPVFLSKLPVTFPVLRRRATSTAPARHSAVIAYALLRIQRDVIIAV